MPATGFSQLVVPGPQALIVMKRPGKPQIFVVPRLHSRRRSRVNGAHEGSTEKVLLIRHQVPDECIIASTAPLYEFSYRKWLSTRQELRPDT